MAAEKQAAPLPLSVVFVKEEKKKHAPAGAPFLPVPGVRDVIKWALFNAGCVAFSVVYTLVVSSISNPPSWLLPGPDVEPDEVTDAGADDVALMLGVLWWVCVVSQAAAGALALALPRRHRLPLAYAALVATAAGHCMWAASYTIMFVAPRVFTFWNGVNAVVFFVLGVGDLLCFRGLVLRGGEEE